MSYHRLGSIKDQNLSRNDIKVQFICIKIDIFLLDYDFWMRNGKHELDIALKRIYHLRGEKDSSKLKRPKNVLFFVGDGMSLTTITASRIYRGQQEQQRSGEELLLSWEEFPETALLKVNQNAIRMLHVQDIY